MTERREELLTMLQYFWTEKGDITRYCDYEEAITEFPQVKFAWDQYKHAEAAMSWMVENQQP